MNTQLPFKAKLLLMVQYYSIQFGVEIDAVTLLKGGRLKRVEAEALAHVSYDLHRKHGMTPPAIARWFNCSESTVRYRIGMVDIEKGNHDTTHANFYIKVQSDARKVALKKKKTSRASTKSEKEAIASVLAGN